MRYSSPGIPLKGDANDFPSRSAILAASVFAPEYAMVVSARPV